MSDWNPAAHLGEEVAWFEAPRTGQWYRATLLYADDDEAVILTTRAALGTPVPRIEPVDNVRPIPAPRPVLTDEQEAWLKEQFAGLPVGTQIRHEHDDGMADWIITVPVPTLEDEIKPG